MNTSKEAIMSALRSAEKVEGFTRFEKPDLSALEGSAIKYEDPLKQFCQALKGSGGEAVEAEEFTPKETGLGLEQEIVVSGIFGVAENGAVWLEPSDSERSLLFTPENLVIRLRRSEIVNNMHEAYLRLGETPRHYGIFIAGPSKTADIEQALVFGAHGARSLKVVLE